MVEEKQVPTPEEADQPVAEQTAALKDALAQEKARAEIYLAHLQRSQADFVNLKRRTEQDKAEASKFASATLILNLLPVLDDLERAFTSVPAQLASLTWVEGIHLIYRKLAAVLEAQDLSTIKAVGEKFDPRLHEAVQYVEGEEGVVLEEVQRGYRLHDRVIRPTLAVVGKGQGKATEGSSQRPPAEEGC